MVFQLSNYSSMEGVLYCKPHFEQLFKETGNFNKNFQSRMFLILAEIDFFSITMFLVFNLQFISFSTAAKSAEKLNPELVNVPCNTVCIWHLFIISEFHLWILKCCGSLILYGCAVSRQGHLAKLLACFQGHKKSALLAVKLLIRSRR